jgi:hypothetical protein
MSVNDLATLGHSIGFSPTLDNPKAAKYQPSITAVTGSSGNGYTNNRVFASSSDNQTVAGVANAAVTRITNIKLVDMLILPIQVAKVFMDKLIL